MLRYCLFLIVFFGGICFAVFVSGGSLLSILDLPSFLFTGVVPFLFVSVLFGFKNMASAFAVSVRKEAESGKAENAVKFFKTYGKITWIAGGIAVFIGTVLILWNLGDPSAIGPNLALALISLLYSGIINAAVIIPFTVFAGKAGRIS